MPSFFTHLDDVVFNGLADNLAPDDFNDEWDVFAYDNGRVGSFFTLTPCRLKRC